MGWGTESRAGVRGRPKADVHRKAAEGPRRPASSASSGFAAKVVQGIYSPAMRKAGYESGCAFWGTIGGTGGTLFSPWTLWSHPVPRPTFQTPSGVRDRLQQYPSRLAPA